MKLAYVTVNDVLNKNVWSKNEQGLWAASYHIAKHLADDFNSIHYITPKEKNFAALTRIKWTYYRNLFNKDYYRWTEPIVLKDYARQIKNQLLNLQADAVICPENIVPIAYLDCKQPIVLWTDSTLSSLINFYPHMDNLCRESIKNIYKNEAEALRRCNLLIYTSDWAAQNAIDIYNVSPDKIKILPWCANFDCKRNLEDIHSLLKSKPCYPIKLLFIGVNWLRKGGETALQVAKELNEQGFKTELIVVGCKPQTDRELPNFVKVIEFIDKSKPKGVAELNKLFAEAHFLILPSLADCTPIVFSEANSFALPCLSTNVGGIPTIVQNGCNGQTFSLKSAASEYCTYIRTLIEDYQQYKQLALSSFEQYQVRLNWNVTVKQAKRLISELIS